MSIGSAFTQAEYLQWSTDGLTSPGVTRTGKNINQLGSNTGDGYTVSASFTSVPVLVKSLRAWSIQVSCPSTGSPNGTISIQASNDLGVKDEPNSLLLNWTTLYFFDAATATWVNSKSVTGASSVVLQQVANPWRWIRFVWTNSTGSATLTVSLQQGGS